MKCPLFHFSLFAENGSLYTPVDKNALINALNDLCTAQMDTSFDNRQADRVLLVDAMVVVQSVKISYVYHNCIQESFTKKVESMFGSFQEGSIVFDRCIEQTLKANTRQKEATQEYEVH